MLYDLFFGFSGRNQGWQESHALQSSETNVQTFLPLLQDLAQKRANFLGAPYEVVAVGLRKFYDETLDKRAKGSALIKQVFTSATPTLTGDAEPADVAILGTWQPNASTPATADFSGNFSISHFGAPPDAAVSNGGVVNQGAAGLGAAIASFRSAMIGANTGWFTAVREDDVKINSIAQNADGTITITLARAPVPAPVVNIQQTVRVRRINKGKTPIPGQLLGHFATATTFVSTDPIGIPTPQLGGFMRTYNQTPFFIPYAGLIVQGIVGDHKRGRPFGSPRGREPARVRG